MMSPRGSRTPQASPSVARPDETLVDGPFATKDQAVDACIDYAARLTRMGQGAAMGVRVARYTSQPLRYARWSWGVFIAPTTTSPGVDQDAGTGPTGPVTATLTEENHRGT